MEKFELILTDALHMTHIPVGEALVNFIGKFRVLLSMHDLSAVY